MKSMHDWDSDEDLLSLQDALERPGCPRCSSSLFEHDAEFRASVCEDCGLWLEDPDPAVFEAAESL